MARKKAETSHNLGAQEEAEVLHNLGAQEEAEVSHNPEVQEEAEVQRQTYDPETQLVVNKAAFRTLVVSLASGRVGMYRKGALQMRLCELLGLESVEEAQKFITEVYESVSQQS